MKVFNTIADLQAILTAHRQDGQQIALVPTMGNLHEGIYPKSLPNLSKMC